MAINIVSRIQNLLIGFVSKHGAGTFHGVISAVEETLFVRHFEIFVRSHHGEPLDAVADIVAAAFGIKIVERIAGDADNPTFRAKSAEATMFIRCIREDDLYAGLEKIKKIGEKYGVVIEQIERDYCQPTDFEGEAFKKIENLLHTNFPDVAVVPFLLTAGTDARRLTDVADNILRFAPIDLSKEQFATIHGANENIRIKNIGECVVFYKDVIKTV